MEWKSDTLLERLILSAVLLYITMKGGPFELGLILKIARGHLLSEKHLQLALHQPVNYIFLLFLRRRVTAAWWLWSLRELVLFFVILNFPCLNLRKQLCVCLNYPLDLFVFLLQLLLLFFELLLEFRLFPLLRKVAGLIHNFIINWR